MSHTVKSCLYQSLRKMWRLAMTTVILMNIKDSKKGSNDDWDPTSFEASCPSSQPIYWHKEILKTLSVIWSCLKNKMNSEGSRIKRGIYSTKTMKCVSFEIAKTKSKNFSLKKTMLLCNDVCSVIEALGHQHDPTERCFFYWLFTS